MDWKAAIKATAMFLTVHFLVLGGLVILGGILWLCTKTGVAIALIGLAYCGGMWYAMYLAAILQDVAEQHKALQKDDVPIEFKAGNEFMTRFVIIIIAVAVLVGLWITYFVGG